MSEKFLTWVLGPFIVSLIYFSGFSYLSSYYNFYGISIIEISPPIQFVFSHSFPAIKRTILEFWYFYIFVIFTSAFVYLVFRNFKFGKAANFLALAAASVAFFILAYLIGNYSGEAQARENLQNLKIMTTEDDNQFKVGKGYLRHILTTSTMTYALKFHPDGDNFWTIRIPSDKLKSNAVFMDSVR